MKRMIHAMPAGALLALLLLSPLGGTMALAGPAPKAKA